MMATASAAPTRAAIKALGTRKVRVIKSFSEPP
jgi:hypothetical protein